jgi:hypothetical protein
MKKLMMLIVIGLLIFSVPVYSKVIVEENNKDYSVVGTIKIADHQGNNYLKLTLTTPKDNKEIFIWCSGEKTKVFSSNKEVFWSELKLGRKIKVVGTWINQDGEKLLWANRINLLL